MENTKAFPVSIYEPGRGSHLEEGMDLRDYFAAKAMQAYITAIRGSGGSINRNELVESSYGMADEMIKERNKTNHD